MSFITAQQAKLDIELVPKEKRLKIRKCNGRLNPGKTQREPTFQVILDALALTPCYSAFLTTADVPEGYMHQFWDSIQKHDTSYRFRLDKKKKLYLNLETFRDIFQICPRVHGQDFDELPTDEVIISLSGNTSGLDKLRLSRAQILWGMYYKKNVDYVELLWEYFTYQIDNKVSPEEPTRKLKRVKRLAKKSMNAPTAGVVLRDTPMMSLSKKKEKMIVEKRKGIELLSEVALTEEAYDSGDDNTQSNKEKGSDSDHETDGNETGSESDQEENEEEVEDDEEEKEDEFVKTLSNYKSTDDEDETNEESKVKDNAEGDEDKGMDYTTNQFDDDVDVRLNEPVNNDEGFIQKEVHVYHEVPSNQTPILLTILVLVITESSPVYTTIITQSLLYFTPPPPQSTPTPPPTTEASNPLSALLNFTSVFHFNNRVLALEKEVTKLKKDDLLSTQVTALLDEHLDTRLGATGDEFMSYRSTSITATITKQVKIQLPQILPKEVSNFAPLVIKSMVNESLQHAVLAKETSQPKSTYEAAALLTEFELKKILIDKIDESQSYLIATEHRECYY
ncbi:hypothetical protein Tco_0336367 [Tanacetum coccineum]